MTPEQQAAYYGPPTDLGEIDGPPVRDMGELDGPAAYYGPPPVAPPVDQWNGPQWNPNAPATAAPFSSTAPPPPPPSAPLPSFARGPAQPDTEPATPVASSADQAAIASALGGFGAKMAPAANPAPRTWGSGGPAAPSEGSTLQKDMLGTLEGDKELTRDIGQADQQRADLLTGRGMELAEQKKRDQLDAQLRAADEAVRFRTYQEETQRQLDDVKSQVIQPNRAYSDTGSKMMAVLGGLMGGLYQGINKLQSNPFIDQMNKVIDRDIAIQQADIATKKGAVSERKSLLADMRLTYKDEALAKAQAKNLYFEAAKEHLLAEAATYDSPIIRAKVEMAVNGISREQQKLRLEQLQREAAARASAAAAASAAAEKQRKNDLDERKVRVEEANANTAARKVEGETDGKTGERFVATGKDKEGNPTGYLAHTTVVAGEKEGAREARAELLAELQTALAIRKEAGTVGRTLNRSNPNDLVQLYTPEWQVKIRQQGAVIKGLANKAAKFGTIDAGTVPLLEAMAGDLESRGGESDVRLQGMIDKIGRSEAVAANSAGGQTGTMVVGRDGKQHFVPSGGQNAPTNQRTVARESVK